MSKTRYPWHLAPSWAVIATTSPNGNAFWHGFAPDGGGWAYESEKIPGKFEASDWGNSLETRPPKLVQTVDEFEAERRRDLRDQFAGQIFAAWCASRLTVTENRTFNATRAVAEAEKLVAALYPEAKESPKAPLTKLSWRRESDGLHFAKTPFGTYIAQLSEDDNEWVVSLSGIASEVPNLGLAMAWAEGHFNSALQECLSPSND